MSEPSIPLTPIGPTVPTVPTSADSSDDHFDTIVAALRQKFVTGDDVLLVMGSVAYGKRHLLERLSALAGLHVISASASPGLPPNQAIICSPSPDPYKSVRDFVNDPANFPTVSDLHKHNPALVDVISMPYPDDAFQHNLQLANEELMRQLNEKAAVQLEATLAEQTDYDHYDPSTLHEYGMPSGRHASALLRSHKSKPSRLQDSQRRLRNRANSRSHVRIKKKR